MRSLITLVLVLMALKPVYATVIRKEFSERMTFPFEGGGYKIRGVPRNVIYLTIDDGPSPQGTPAMLDILEDHQVSATFFVHGNQAERRPHLLERMYREGHLVANHSYSHVLDFPSSSSFVNSLMVTHNIITPYIAPEGVLLYRAPGGVWNDWRSRNGNNHSTLRRYVGPLFWNVGGGSPNRQDDADWKCWRRGNGVTVNACADSYYQQILSNYKKGQASLVLLHDIRDLSAKLVDRLVRRLKRDGIDWEFRLADDMPIVREYANK